VLSGNPIVRVTTVAAACAIALLVPGRASSGLVVATSGVLTMSSEPGDYVGAGQDWSYDAQSDYMKVGSETWGTARVFLFGANGSDFWSLNFTAPGGARLTPGDYPDARRTFDDLHPGLDVEGMGRGCNDSTGSFTVLAVSYGPYGYLQSLHATFEQRCGVSTAALRGEINVVAPAAPTPLTISATVDPNGIVDRGDGTVQLHGTASCSQHVPVASISGDVLQQQKKGTASGYFNQVSVTDCDATPKAWQATVTLSSTLRFSACAATTETRAAAVDEFYTNYFGALFVAQATTNTTLTLRNG
jgi:hypothetical protein